MKTKYVLLIGFIIFLMNCRKSDLASVPCPPFTETPPPDGISFKIQPRDSAQIWEFTDAELSRTSYTVSYTLPDRNPQVIDLQDSVYLTAYLIYEFVLDSNSMHGETLTVSFHRAEALKNLELREPWTFIPTYDYPDKKDIVKKLFPTGIWNPNTDNRMIISITDTDDEGNFLRTHATEFPMENTNAFNLSDAVFIMAENENENETNKVWLKGNFECTILNHSNQQKEFEISEAQFSAVLDLGI